MQHVYPCSALPFAPTCLVGNGLELAGDHFMTEFARNQVNEVAEATSNYEKIQAFDSECCSMFPGCKCSGSGDSDEDEMEGWDYEHGGNAIDKWNARAAQGTLELERSGRSGKDRMPLYERPPSGGQKSEGVVTRSLNGSRADSQGYGADISPAQGANMNLQDVMSMPTSILSSLTDTNSRGYDDTQVTGYAPPEPNYWPVQSTPTVPLPTEVLGPSKFTALSADSLRDPPLAARECLPTFEGIPQRAEQRATFGAAPYGTADFGKTAPTGGASPIFGRPELGGARATMGASPLPTANFGAV